MENLVLSVINKDYTDLERFFVSLRNTGYKGHVCIFAGPNSDDVYMKELAEVGVEIIRFSTEFPYVDNPHPDNFKYLPSPMIIFNYRYYLYYDYLLKNKKRFSNILLTDIRDVVFQRDPFGIIRSDALYVAVENQDINNCVSTRTWGLNAYSEEVLDSIGNQRVGCSGTTLGSTAHIMRYCKAMLSEMLNLPDVYNCFCQPIHNVLLYQNKLEPTVKLGNEDGQIMTIGTADPTGLHYDKEGYMLGDNGERAYIVHQGDRHISIVLQTDKFVFKSFLPTFLSKRNFSLVVTDVKNRIRASIINLYLTTPGATHVWRALKK